MKIHARPCRRYLIFVVLIFVSRAWSEPLRVVAATADLAAVAEEVGRGAIHVESICPANQDPHEFEILPRHVVAVQHAAVYLKVGAGLDFWSDALLRSVGNELVVVDCSRGVELIRGESGELKHGPSHEHELGNPHYWLAPQNLQTVAQNIADGFIRARPADSANFARNQATFASRLDTARAAWRARMEPCRGQHLVSYHRAWDYFAREYGLTITGTVEPQPGAEPSPAYLALLEQQIRATRTQLLLLEPFEPERYARLLSSDTGISVIDAPPSVGGISGTGTVFSWFDYLTRAISAHCAEISHP